MPLVFGGRVWLNCGIPQAPEQLLLLSIAGCERTGQSSVGSRLLQQRTIPMCLHCTGLSLALRRWTESQWGLLGFPKVVPGAHWKIPLTSPVVGLNPFVGHWVPVCASSIFMFLSSLGQGGDHESCFVSPCSVHLITGRETPVPVLVLFVSHALTQGFI